MHDMMTSHPGMMGHTEWAFAIVWFLLVVNLSLSAAALAKHLFSRR